MYPVIGTSKKCFNPSPTLFWRKEQKKVSTILQKLIYFILLIKYILYTAEWSPLCVYSTIWHYGTMVLYYIAQGMRKLQATTELRSSTLYYLSLGDVTRKKLSHFIAFLKKGNNIFKHYFYLFLFFSLLLLFFLLDIAGKFSSNNNIQSLISLYIYIQ